MNKPSFEKTIWMLWLQGEEAAPDLVKSCIQSWRRKNPGWQVKVLEQTDVDALLASDAERNIASKMPPAALSNLVRTKILLTRGGVWCDATLACMIPLDHWLAAFMTQGFFAFSRPSRDKPLSSWFLAAKPNHYVMQRWFDLSVKIWSQTTIKSVDGVEDLNRLVGRMGADGKVWRTKEFWQDIELMPYHWFHYAFDYLLQHDKMCRNIWTVVPKCSANLPHMVQERRMLFDENWSLADFSIWVENNMAPLFKLNWRSMKPEENAKLRFLLDYCSGA